MDWTLILLIPAVLLTLYAQTKIKTTYSQYAKVPSRLGVTGQEVARRMLDMNGLENVAVQQVAGTLTDHYDPSKKTVNLSQSIYGSSSIAALSVAAHECGHALQDKESYGPLRLRSTLVPVANIGSSASWLLILGGVALSMANLITIGILLFSAAVLFQVVTLPVEFNASSRALATLESEGFLTDEEVPHARKMLSAAALTYVAAALTSILQLLRLVLIFGRRK